MSLIVLIRFICGVLFNSIVSLALWLGTYEDLSLSHLLSLLPFGFLCLRHLCLHLSFCKEWYLTPISRGTQDFLTHVCKEHWDIYREKKWCLDRRGYWVRIRPLADIKDVWNETQSLRNTFFSNLSRPLCPSLEGVAESCLLALKGPRGRILLKLLILSVWLWMGNCECAFSNLAGSHMEETSWKLCFSKADFLDKS